MFLAQLTNKFMQNNFHTNKQLQKQPAVVAMLPKVSSTPVFSFFLVWRLFCAICASRKDQAVKAGWGWFGIGKRRNEQITAPRNWAH